MALGYAVNSLTASYVRPRLVRNLYETSNRVNLGVALVSGGLDSCFTAASAAREVELAFLHLNYRQRTEQRELAAFTALAGYFGAAQHLVVDITYMHKIGGSSLTDERMPVPKGDHGNTLPSTYVPFRNANLLGIAVAWAETIGASAIYIGAHEEESVYPDCRGEFFRAYQQMTTLGTDPQTDIRIRAPLIDMDKATIVRKGLKLNAPLHLTWSCYQNENIACGQCASCRLRQESFRRAGANDPIAYT